DSRSRRRSVGVWFSVSTILVYQGAIALGASALREISHGGDGCILDRGGRRADPRDRFPSARSRSGSRRGSASRVGARAVDARERHADALTARLDAPRTLVECRFAIRSRSVRAPVRAPWNTVALCHSLSRSVLGA